MSEASGKAGQQRLQVVGVSPALSGKGPQEMRPKDRLERLRQLGWRPRVLYLRGAARPEERR